jgi:hypothetical protein
MYKKKFTIFSVGYLVIGTILSILVFPQNGLIEIVEAETLTFSSVEDFESGISTFVEISEGQQKLERGLNCQWTVNGRMDNNHYGYSVASAGDLNGDGYDDVVVSEPFNDEQTVDAGKIYIYLGSNKGLSVDPFSTALGEGVFNYFGYSVSSAGDVNGDGYDDIIVGAYGNDEGWSDAGKVYVGNGSAGGLSTEIQPWMAIGENLGDQFGIKVASAGDVNGDGFDDVLIGAYSNDDAGTNYGKMYLYEGSSTGLAKTDSWNITGENVDDYLGGMFAGAGDINSDGYDDVMVGSPNYDDSGIDRGKVYVYYGASSGLGNTPDWTKIGEAAGDGLGYSVDSAGDVNLDGFDDVVIGAYKNNDGNTNAGKAYLYLGSENGLQNKTAWNKTGHSINEQFGAGIAGAGDINADGYDDVIIGANWNSDVGTNTGKVFCYFGTDTGLSSSAFWTVSGEKPNDQIGIAIAGAGDIDNDGYDDILIGSSYYDWVSSGSNRGKVYLYQYLPEMKPESLNKAYAGGEFNGDQFGSSVDSAGDVNGDGFDDVIISATYNDETAPSAGKVYVHNGTTNGLDSANPWTDLGEGGGDVYGSIVSGAGDINGDGYGDIIVGAPGNDSGGINSGKVYVYNGSVTGLLKSNNWTVVGEAANDYFGDAVASAGDVNGDGYDDIIVGATYNDHGASNGGKIYLYNGSGSGLVKDRATEIVGTRNNGHFGQAVGSAGDVNADGYDDIIVGAPWDNEGGSQAGKVYVYHGSPRGVIKTPAWSVVGDSILAYFGNSVNSAGDVNGDGYDDVIIGASNNDESGNNAGKVYVYLGSSTGLNTTPAWIRTGEAANNFFGISVDGDGDVNGDGYDDVIIGAHNYDYSYVIAGKAYIFPGSPNGLSREPIWTKVGEYNADYFGISVRSAGDIDGDGLADVVIGAVGNDRSVGNAGGAFVFGAPKYMNYGTYESETFSTSGTDQSKLLSIQWDPMLQPEGTEVKFQIGRSNDGAKWVYSGQDGNINDYFQNPKGNVIFSEQISKFWKYKVFLSSWNTIKTPVLDEISINLKSYEMPSVTLTSPNGGEDWMKGKYYPITWDASGDLNSTPISIYYSTDLGGDPTTQDGNWTPIAQNIQNIGIYNWTVPSIETANAVIIVLVMDIYDNYVVDTSDASFAIDPPPPGADGVPVGIGGEGSSQMPVDKQLNTPEEPETILNDQKEKQTPDDNSILISVISIILIISIILNIFFLVVHKRIKNSKTSSKKIDLKQKVIINKSKPRR